MFSGSIVSMKKKKQIKKVKTGKQPLLAGNIHCLFDEIVDVTKLVAHDKNPNKHSKEQIERLAKILEYQGWRYPVKVSKLSGMITSGHGRLEAALLNGWTGVPVNYQDYSDEAQEYADVVADNAIAEWADLDLAMINNDFHEFGPDFDIELLGIKDFDLDPTNEETDESEDEVPDKVPTVSVLGDIYILGEHRLMCGDSTSIDAVEKLMNGEKADMVFTDPPYNIDYSPEDRAIGGRARSKNKLGKIDNDKMSDDSFYDFLSGVNSSILSVAKEGCPIYQCAPIGMNNLQYLMAWRDAGFHYSDGLIWLKNNHSISRKDYHPKHEVIHYGWTQGSHAWYGDRNKFSVFECSREKVTDYKHPTQKPCELSEHYIANSSKNNEIVLDLFGGSGSTLIACEKTQRKCYMMELDPHYIDVIVSRWCKYTGETTVIRNGEEIEWEL